MFLKNYFLYADRVDLLLMNNSFLTIHFNDHSGAIHYRYKIDTGGLTMTVNS